MIEKFEVFMPQFQKERMIHVYLPDNYHQVDESYPVLYMFDGHNMFLDQDATYGHAWNWPKYMEQYRNKCIIVGQECSHEGNARLSEYGPYNFYDHEFGLFVGKGKETMDFFIHTLKPIIDKKYRTKKGRTNTWIGGSSCGGLMAYFALMNYSSTYSKALVTSPYLYPTFQKLYEETEKADIHKNSQFYISWGALEGGTHGFLHETIYCTQLSNLLMKKGNKVYFNVKENGKHTEQDWEDEIPMMLDFLFENGSFCQD